MKKNILLLLICFFVLQFSQAQTVDSTFLLLDKAPITTGILYPHFSSDSNALWLKYDGVKDSLANSRRWKQAPYYRHSALDAESP